VLLHSFCAIIILKGGIMRVFKKKLVYVLMILALVGVGCRSNGQVRAEETRASDEPMITGIIRKIEDTKILVVADEENPNAMNLNLTEETEIVSGDEDKKTMDFLRVGMEVECYGSGIILDTYPSQSDCEKVVIHKDFVMPRLTNNSDRVKLLYIGKDLSKGFPLIGIGLNMDFSLPFDKDTQYEMRFEMGMDDGLYYYDLSGDEPSIYCYKGTLNIYLKQNGVFTEKSFKLSQVVIPADYEPDFQIGEDYIEFSLMVYRDNSTEIQSIRVDKNGKIGLVDLAENVSFKLGGTDYRIEGNKNRRIYYIVDPSKNKIAQLPEEMSPFIDGYDKTRTEITINEQEGKLSLCINGQLFVYNTERWLSVNSEAYVYEAYFIDENLLELHTRSQGKTYFYNISDEALTETVNVGQSHMDKGIHWDGQVYFDYVYQVGKDINPLVFIETPALEISYEGKDYKIIDSFTYGEKTYILNENKDQLLDLSTGKNILKEAISYYDYSEGTFAYEKSETKEWYYYCFDSKKNGLISDMQKDMAIVRVHHGEIACVDFSGRISLFSVEENKEIDTFKVTDVISGLYEDELQLDFDKNNIYINVGTTYVIDRQSHEIKDHFSTREIHVAENGRVFYTLLGNLIEYDPTTRKHWPIGINDYCVYLTTEKDQVIVYSGIDGPGTYAVYSMDVSWFDTEEGKGLDQSDYIVFHQSTEYGSELYIYNRIEGKFVLLEDSEGMIDYKVEEEANRIMYQSQRRGLYGEETEAEKEPTYFNLKKGASISIYDAVIRSYKKYFDENVEKGYVFSSEFYELDQGQFMMFASPFYNDGRFDEKGIEIFIKGLHQKNYSLTNNAFRLPSRAEISVFMTNEERNVYYIVYELDGEKYGVVLEEKSESLSFDIIEEISFKDYTTEEDAFEYLNGKDDTFLLK